MISANCTENKMSAGEAHIGFAIKDSRTPGIHAGVLVLHIAVEV
jgi:hypothetical protein